MQTTSKGKAELYKVSLHKVSIHKVSLHKVTLFFAKPIKLHGPDDQKITLFIFIQSDKRIFQSRSWKPQFFHYTVQLYFLGSVSLILRSSSYKAFSLAVAPAG